VIEHRAGALARHSEDWLSALPFPSLVDRFATLKRLGPAFHDVDDLALTSLRIDAPIVDEDLVILLVAGGDRGIPEWKDIIRDETCPNGEWIVANIST
jgi:hypothetical protein